MRIDAHSVVYFVNEAYGVVIRANGANKEVAMWDPGRKCFARRLDLVTASFLARVDRFKGKWCAAHPTYRLTTALRAAERLVPCVPNEDGMRLAREAKLRAMRARLHEVGCEAMMREIVREWREREEA